MKDPNYAPMYCALYPALAKVTRSFGYALSVHGTLGRDMDLVCIPWTKDASEPNDVVDAITKKFDLRKIVDKDGEFTLKEHGRIAYTLSIGFGECFIDLSFMPRISKSNEARDSI